MKYKAIAALAAVAQHGSFTAAADAQGCSKAFLSEQVKLLEKEYATQLILRTTRKLSLTPAGRDFVARCNEGFNQLQLAEEMLLTEQAQLSGVIRIASAGGLLGEDIVAPSLHAFMAKHPQVQIELDFSSQNVNLLSGDYDLAVRFGEPADSSLIARPYLRFHSNLVASPVYIEQHGKPENLDELSNHRLITGTISRWTFYQGTQSRILTPKSVLQCGNGKVMLAAALNGVGIAYLPDFYTAAAVAQNQLVPLLPVWTQRQDSVNLLYPPGRYRLARVQALIEHLLEKSLKG